MRFRIGKMRVERFQQILHSKVAFNLFTRETNFDGTFLRRKFHKNGNFGLL